jgi:RNA polymerase sigma-70 factor (ECF subfamily)
VTVSEERAEQPHEEFTRLTDPFRRELLVFCYRMMGSVHDAEDLVQETYLRAWRSYDRFEGRSSTRTWLYRIAQNACLNALRHSNRRTLPSGLGGGSTPDPERTGAEPGEMTWLEPFPDRLRPVHKADPAEIVSSRASLRLAFIAALQYLPPGQRAVLILRDALGWPAQQVAELLETTVVSVNSSLQRARARLERLTPSSDEVAEPDDPRRRELLDRYVAAFENVDIDALTDLLTEDTVWEMPPNPGWYTGVEGVRGLLTTRLTLPPGSYRMLHTTANTQPAVAFYILDPTGERFEAHAIHVLTVTPKGIAHVTSFIDPSLFPLFGQPDHLPAR